MRLKGALTGDDRLPYTVAEMVRQACTPSLTLSSPSLSRRSSPSLTLSADSPRSMAPVTGCKSLKMDARVHLAVLASHTDPEAISAAFLISTMLRKSQQWHTIELLHPRDVERAVDVGHKPENLAILLTQGALTSEGFPNTLMMAVGAWGSFMGFLTV